MTGRTTDKKLIELFFKHNKLSLVYSDSSSFSVSVSDWLSAEPGMYASSILSPSMGGGSWGAGGGIAPTIGHNDS